MKLHNNLKNAGAAGSPAGPRMLTVAIPLVLALILTGCFTARPGERELLQRDRVEGASEELGRELPELAEDSGLNEFARYAVLNSPEVRAAYYSWEAAVSEIVPARYLPDLSLAFEAEISDMADDMYMGGARFQYRDRGRGR